MPPASSSRSNEPDVSIADWLVEQGLESAEAQAAARLVLESAGLTRPGKRRIHRDKLDRAAVLLLGGLFRVCEGCSGQGVNCRPLVLVDRSRCAVCGGSRLRSAALRVGGELERRGIERVLVVGGTPSGTAQLRNALADVRARFEFIDGTRSPGRDRAKRLCEAAGVVVLWGNTPLDHAVSDFFTDGRTRGKSVTVTGRAPTAVLEGIAGFLARN